MTTAFIVALFFIPAAFYAGLRYERRKDNWRRGIEVGYRKGLAERGLPEAEVIGPAEPAIPPCSLSEWGHP